MPPVARLTGAAYGVHFADQIALVCVPLIAALVFDASAGVIGLLVACQSMAHLLGSIPFGILVDNTQQRSLAIGATLISLIGFAGAGVAVMLGSLLWFGLCVTAAGFGVVLFVLTTLSILPKAVAPTGLTAANAGIELPRALASFGAPLAIGLIISTTTAPLVFPLAALGAAVACVFAYSLPRFEIIPNDNPQHVLRRIVDGGQFVRHHDLLRPISFCAIFWSASFSALLVTMVPLIRDVYNMDAGIFGIALACFGLGAVSGSWTSRQYGGRIAPKYILLAGPVSAAIGALILCLIPNSGSTLAIYAAFFLIGFIPSMWLIAQNTVRQIVSPGNMLGRVNAVIQTAIYGMRPIAALLAGVIVSATSPRVGLYLVLAGFTLSSVAAIFSRLRTIESYAALQAEVAQT